MSLRFFDNFYSVGFTLMVLLDTLCCSGLLIVGIALWLGWDCRVRVDRLLDLLYH
jgi:hypothetical protein